MSWLWIHFLCFICYPFMSTDKFISLHEYYFHKHVARKRKRKIKRIARKNTL